MLPSFLLHFMRVWSVLDTPFCGVFFPGWPCLALPGQAEVVTILWPVLMTQVSEDAAFVRYTLGWPRLNAANSTESATHCQNIPLFHNITDYKTTKTYHFTSLQNYQKYTTLPHCPNLPLYHIAKLPKPATLPESATLVEPHSTLPPHASLQKQLSAFTGHKGGSRDGPRCESIIKNLAIPQAEWHRLNADSFEPGRPSHRYCGRV